MKAVTQVLSHSALLLIGLIAASLIIVAVSSSVSVTEKNLVRTELNYIAESAKNRVLEAYSIMKQETEYSNASFALNLPQEIGERNYLLRLEQGNLFLTIPFRNENIEVVRTLNIDAEISGESYLPASLLVEKSGGNITMTLVG